MRSNKRPVEAAAASSETSRADRATTKAARMPRSLTAGRAVEVHSADRASARIAMKPRSATVNRAVDVQRRQSASESSDDAEERDRRPCRRRATQSRPSANGDNDDAEERNRRQCRRSAAQPMPVERAVNEASSESCCCLERDEGRADRAPARVATMPRSATVDLAVDVQHRAPARVAMMPRSATERPVRAAAVRVRRT